MAVLLLDAASRMSSHTADEKRFESASATSLMYSMQHNAHVHQPVPGRHVPYRCMHQERPTDLGLTAHSSGN
eukprot:12920326-Prorocentrum_lima.AAC.1